MAKKSYFELNCPICDQKFTAVVESGSPATWDSPAEGPEICTEGGCDCSANLSYTELSDLLDVFYSDN